MLFLIETWYNVQIKYVENCIRNKRFGVLLQTGVAYSVPTVDVLAPSGSSSDPHTQKLWELSVKQIHVSLQYITYLGLVLF